MNRREFLGATSASMAALGVPSLAFAIGALPPKSQALKGFEALKRAHIASQNGAPFALSQFAGKGLLVNFWANWCPNCLAELQSMHIVRDAVRAVAPFEVVLVSQQKDWVNDQVYAAQHQFDFPLYVHTWNNDDPRQHADYVAVACSYQSGNRMVDPMPLTYMIDKNEELVAVIRGGPDWTMDALKPAVLKTIHPENRFDAWGA